MHADPDTELKDLLVTCCFQEVLQTDENCGLVQQVVQSQTRTNIKKLTKTFVTLSLSDVASRWVL
jgi:hypothetical protein